MIDGGIEAALKANVNVLAGVPGIGSRTAKKIRWTVEEPRATYVRHVVARPLESDIH